MLKSGIQQSGMSAWSDFFRHDTLSSVYRCLFYFHVLIHGIHQSPRGYHLQTPYLFFVQEFTPARLSGGQYIGYCVTSLSPEKTGEIESIFVEEEYRALGIGPALVTRALAWLNENGSVRNRVPVCDGNEEVWNFYKKFGFHLRMMVLEQMNE